MNNQSGPSAVCVYTCCLDACQVEGGDDLKVDSGPLVCGSVDVGFKMNGAAVIGCGQLDRNAMRGSVLVDHGQDRVVGGLAWDIAYCFDNELPVQSPVL